MENKPYRAKDIHIFSDQEYDILQRYSNRRTVEYKDKEFITKLASIGFINTGFHQDQCGIYETAAITEIGKELANLERITRDPKALKFFKRLDWFSKLLG
ncbi:MAG: hypothetical protein Q7S33_03130 [Nanoarchaeota archaeon]|nr:hypothetical protein [Nanoarchaeota archaeon]